MFGLVGVVRGKFFSFPVLAVQLLKNAGKKAELN